MSAFFNKKIDYVLISSVNANADDDNKSLLNNLSKRFTKATFYICGFQYQNFSFDLPGNGKKL